MESMYEDAEEENEGDDVELAVVGAPL